MHKLNKVTYDAIEIGATASFDIVVSAEMIERFALLSGDTNPLHLDDSYAVTTVFGQRIAHGMLAASFLSQLIGVYLPGYYGVYLSQNLLFHRPIYVGAKISIRGEVVQKVDALRAIKIKTEVRDVNSNEVCISGDALVKVLQ